MRKDRLIWGFAIVLVALLAWAWYDGGEREQHVIVQTVELPGAPK